MSRGLLLAVLCSLLLGLTACAARPGQTAGDEVLTESDEPDARKRARLRHELATVYFENGQTTVALDEIKQSLAADPAYGPAHVLRGLVHMRLNNERMAEESFQSALRIRTDDPDALHNLGWLRCQQAQHAQGIGFFARALAVPAYSGQARTWMAQGVCQLHMGQHAEAERSLRRSHELDSAHPVPSYNLAVLLHRRGEDQQARSFIQRLNQSDLANAQTLWLGVRVERRLHNTGAMDQLARQLGQRYSQSPEWALYQRGAFDE
jgi:type IV pilus assembly protein PilF